MRVGHFDGDAGVAQGAEFLGKSARWGVSRFLGIGQWQCVGEDEGGEGKEVAERIHFDGCKKAGGR